MFSFDLTVSLNLFVSILLAKASEQSFLSLSPDGAPSLTLSPAGSCLTHTGNRIQACIRILSLSLSHTHIHTHTHTSVGHACKPILLELSAQGRVSSGLYPSYCFHFLSYGHREANGCDRWGRSVTKTFRLVLCISVTVHSWLSSSRLGRRHPSLCSRLWLAGRRPGMYYH